MLNRAGRTVGVEDLEPVPLHHHLVTDRFQRSGRFFCEDRAWLLIPVDTVSHEVIGGKITDLLHNGGDHVGKKHEAGRVFRDVGDICTHVSMISFQSIL